MMSSNISYSRHQFVGLVQDGSYCSFTLSHRIIEIIQVVCRDIVSIRELPRIIGRVIWWVDFHRAGYADDEVVRLTGWEVCNEEHLTWICGPWSLGMDKYFHPTLHQARDYLSMLGSNLSNVNKAPVTLNRPDSRPFPTLMVGRGLVRS